MRDVLDGHDNQTVLVLAYQYFVCGQFELSWNSNSLVAVNSKQPFTASGIGVFGFSFGIS